MDNRSKQYVDEQLASNGWVLISSKWAAIINPAICGGGQNTYALSVLTLKS